jgi:hypothetical protein
MNNRTSTRMNIAMMLAATMGSLGLRFAESGTVTPKMHSYVPSMVTASPEEIAAWNKAVGARKFVPLSKMHRKTISTRQTKRALYLRHPG